MYNELLENTGKFYFNSNTGCINDAWVAIVASKLETRKHVSNIISREQSTLFQN